MPVCIHQTSHAKGQLALTPSQIGLVFASVILIIIVGNLNTSQLQQWGWRVPFLIGSITAFVVSQWIRLDAAQLYTLSTPIR